MIKIICYYYIIFNFSLHTSSLVLSNKLAEIFGCGVEVEDSSLLLLPDPAVELSQRSQPPL